MKTKTVECFNTGQQLILASWLNAQGSRVEDLRFPPTPVNETDLYRLALKEINIDPAPEGNLVTSLAAGVGRLLLSDIEGRLPDWFSQHPNGQIIRGRSDEGRGKIQKSIGILPVELFQLNWATGAPGFIWPERYYACPVPGDDIIVITASVDTPDVHGYTDWALGWFPNTIHLTEYAGAILRTWWRTQLDEWNQPSWETIMHQGTIKESLALAWRSEVWRDP
jgi:hypothetical protein